MTALHPAGNDEEGKPRKDLWPPPVGTAELISNDRDPLVKMLMQIAGTQDAILEDHLLLVSRDGLQGMLCFRASQIWSNLICGRRLQML